MMKFLLAAVAAVQLAQVHGAGHSLTAAGSVEAGWANHLAAFQTQNVPKIKLDYANISQIFVYDAVNDINTAYSGLAGAEELFTALFKQLGPLADSNFDVDHLTVNKDTKDVFLVWNCESANLKKVTDTFVFDSAGVILRQNIVLWPVDAAKAKAEAGPNNAPRNAGDGMGAVSQAWNNHANAFVGQNMSLMLEDYTEASVIEVFDASQSFSVKFTGLAGVKQCFTGLFADLHNMTGFGAPLLHIEEADMNGAADHDGMVFLGWKAPNSGIVSATDTFIFSQDGKITKQTVVIEADLTKYKGPVVRGWDNHFSAFGASDVAKIKMDYDASSVVRIYNQNNGEISTDTGVDAIGTMFTGLFAALAKDKDGTLAVKHLTVQQDGDFSHVFLVWECPGAGFQKVTDTFVFNPRNGMIVRQNIVVWSNDATAVKGATDGEESKIATQGSLIQSGWDNHFGAFGEQNVSKILLDYTEDSEILVWSISKERLDTFKGLTAIEGLFKSLFASITTDDVGAPVVIVEDGLNIDNGQVFLVWQAPKSGFMKVTDTFVFDADGKIIKQNIVVYDGKVGPVEEWANKVAFKKDMAAACAKGTNSTKGRRESHAGKSCDEMKAMVEVGKIQAAMRAKNCGATRTRRDAHLSGDCAALKALLTAEEKKVGTAPPKKVGTTPDAANKATKPAKGSGNATATATNASAAVTTVPGTETTAAGEAGEAGGDGSAGDGSAAANVVAGAAAVVAAAVAQLF